MTKPQSSLINILKDTSDSMLTLLECDKTRCLEFQPYTQSINAEYCVHSFAYLSNRYGKARVHNVCYKECEKHRKHLGWKE